MNLPAALDAALELPIAPSFTRLGFEARRRLFHWTELGSYDLASRVIVVTGGTSGLGLAAAGQWARCGATVVIVGRNATKTDGVVDEIRRSTGNGSVHAVIADMGDLESVRAAAEQLREQYPRIDALVHNAGALTADRRLSPQGTEMTIASQVVGPFLLTSLLFDRLAGTAVETGRPGRVITMASGGMYSAPLTVSGIELGDDNYNGTKQYAIAKRAQVTLNEMWAARTDPSTVVFQSVHPGWADTPGVEESLPTFRKVVGPLLRDPLAGADTMVWLAADDGEPLSTTGRFWLDRRQRSLHRMGSTRRSDTPERRTRLWNWVSDRAGLEVDPA